MIRKTVKVEIPSGLEARTVAVAVQIASKYDSSMYFEVTDKKVNAKSIMGMMSLGMANGDEVSVSAEGEDEEAALMGVCKFLVGEA